MSTAERVRAVIADVLFVDLDKAVPSAVVMADLGAESIDFLDIMFRLEKEFNIKLPRGETEQKARGDLTEEEFSVGGRLTTEGLANLRKMMPELDASAFKPGLHLREIPSIFTVETFIRMVEQNLPTGAQLAAPANSEASPVLT
ncbi:MAG: phosphopantetheine-binding protein [Proteobacteria bacterium]|nr:phosphopantetheine-binding protein [Pseudomonadota bacterium]